jgi:hypothetical protein
MSSPDAPAAPSRLPRPRSHPAAVAAISLAVVALLGAGFGALALISDGDEPSGRSAIPELDEPEVADAPIEVEDLPALPGPPVPDPASSTSTTRPPADRPAGESRDLGFAEVVVPPGWSVERADRDGALLMTDGAYVEAQILPAEPDRDPVALLTEALATVGDDLEDVEVGQSRDAELLSARAVAGVIVGFEATAVGPSGSAPVEGLVLAYVLQDGKGLVLTAVHVRGQADAVLEDYSTIVQSIAETVEV